MADDLLQGWLDDVHTLAPGADSAVAAAVGHELLACWSEGHRRYHTPQHLREMFAALDVLGPQAELGSREAAVIRIAGWLHDAVYDVQAPPGDSERASADLARNMLTSLSFRDADTASVADLVLMTIDHGTAAASPAGDVFHDVDLWILAAPRERFDDYCAQVRQEYVHVPDDAYAAARSRILGDLIEREHVYRTAQARAGWTAPARANVRREIARLG